MEGLIDPIHNMAWTDYKHFHSKVYASPAEEMYRRAVWEANHRYIQEHNAEAAQGMHTYELGHNKYSDLNSDEYRHVMLGLRFNGIQRNVERRMKNVPLANFGEHVPKGQPTSVDWRKEGYVTAIKDQGQCGSCWSFSATGSMEGQHFNKTKTLVSLSEQNLCDCSGPEGNQGCEGGLMDQAFDYVIKNGGIDTEASYPYTAQDSSTCNFNKANVGATISSYVDIPSGNESALITAIATVGPISVAMDASLPSFQLYHKGVYSPTGCSSSQLDHGVLAVGYDMTNTEQKYYIVKNSWGKTWGMEGYFWMARNKNNMCGIATAASYPLV